MEKTTVIKVRTGQAELALHLLDLTREETAKAERNRLYYVKLARQHGLSHREIGDKLGMTEGGIRMMLNRASE